MNELISFASWDKFVKWWFSSMYVRILASKRPPSSYSEMEPWVEVCNQGSDPFGMTRIWWTDIWKLWLPSHISLKSFLMWWLYSYELGLHDRFHALGLYNTISDISVTYSITSSFKQLLTKKPRSFCFSTTVRLFFPLESCLLLQGNLSLISIVLQAVVQQYFSWWNCMLNGKTSSQKR